MQYQVQLSAIGGALRQAREAKAWSQRELAARSGVTQANISKIETGQVDPQFSTIVELARFLDLEVTLAPRQASPAIEAIIRSASAAHVPPQVARDLDRINAAARVMHQDGEDLLAEAPASFHQTVQRLGETAALLALAGTSFAAPFAARELSRIAAQVNAAQKLVTPTAGARSDFVRRNPKMIEQAERRLAEAVRGLSVLRNTVVHRADDAQRPAYVPDDEDGV
jgi:transcriptional regulator with XRE-family HTH domain